MKAEGIILHKTPFKERDLICHILTRRGQKLGLYIYGGLGGGKSQKGSSLELGSMSSFVLQKDKRNSEVKIAKQDQLIWQAKNIRNHYQAFLLSQFFIELVNKVALEDDMQEVVGEHEGLFNVLSNALFFLDDSLEKDDFEPFRMLLLFLNKLIFHLGIMPDTENCLFCQTDLKKFPFCLLDSANGGFSCPDCVSQRDEFLSDNKVLMEEFKSSTHLKRSFDILTNTKFKDYGRIVEYERSLSVASFNYINYQFGFADSDFKTWKHLLK